MKNRRTLLRLTTSALLAAFASVLMILEFSVPLVPSFIKFDFSELPGLFASIAISPLHGLAVCLIKNIVHLLFTTTGGIGEIANFLLGASFVLTSGYLYRALKKRRASLVISGAAGALAMALFSLPVNYYITYPIYAKMMPLDLILSMYNEINPSVDSLWSALLIFNMPFTFVKCIVCVIISVVLYKFLKPVFAKFGDK